MAQRPDVAPQVERCEAHGGALVHGDAPGGREERHPGFGPGRRQLEGPQAPGSLPALQAPWWAPSVPARQRPRHGAHRRSVPACREVGEAAHARGVALRGAHSRRRRLAHGAAVVRLRHHRGRGRLAGRARSSRRHRCRCRYPHPGRVLRRCDLREPQGPRGDMRQAAPHPKGRRALTQREPGQAAIAPSVQARSALGPRPCPGRERAQRCPPQGEHGHCGPCSGNELRGGRRRSGQRARTPQCPATPVSQPAHLDPRRNPTTTAEQQPCPGNRST